MRPPLVVYVLFRAEKKGGGGETKDLNAVKDYHYSFQVLRSTKKQEHAR